MIPSEIRDRIREGIAPVFVEHGFRGRASTFTRQSADVFQLIQLQGSSANSDSEARFTINVAVWAPSLSSEPKASVENAHWRARLGTLGPERSDTWWHADDFAAADQAAIEIVGRIEEYAFPALQQLGNTSDLLKLWRTGSSPGLTALQADRFRRRLENLARDA
jgi:hypothetical protein